MAKVRLLNGKPLIVGGKVALSHTCCCGGVVPCGPCGGEEFVDCGGCNFLATISGLTLNYGPCLGDRGDGISEIWALLDDVNQSYAMLGDLDVGSNPPGGCVWFDMRAAFTGRIFHYQYSGGPDCDPDFLFNASNVGWEIVIGCSGATWTCAIYNASVSTNGFILFYCESSSPLSFATNAVTFTSANAFSRDNPVLNWVLTGDITGGPCTFMGVGTGGSVTTDFGSHV